MRDTTIAELLAQLERAPGDRGVLAVLGDHLQSVDDPRGKILREFDGKLEIEFSTGKRTIKADLPALRRFAKP